MELDDLKKTWDSAGNSAAGQEITTRMIDRITQEKYHSKIRRITWPEAIGSSICLLAAGYLCFQFRALDTVFLKGTAVLALLLLLALPLISFLSVQPLTQTPDWQQPYAQVLAQFLKSKARFYKLQKINVFLSYLLLVLVIVLLPKLTGGRDISGNKYFWTLSFSFGYLFMLFFSRYVSKAYNRIVKQTGDLLNKE